MKRSVLIGIAAAVTAAAIAGVLSRPYLWPSGETKHAHVMEQARAEPARCDLLSGSGRQAFLFADAEEDA